MAEAWRTVVFTDIEASTRLLRSLGTRYDAVLERHHALMREAVASFGGEVVGTEGDAFFVLFDDPAVAVEACVLAQSLVRAEHWPADGVIRVRMGLHIGEVRRGGDNYIGMGVHQAARVAPTAHGGQIVLSEAVADALGQELPQSVGLLDLGEFHLRDFDKAQRLYQVLHPNLEAEFPPPRAASAVVHNLPAARTSFVGRGAELDELVKAIDTARLVTLVGPGGVGKTRLASELGLRVAGRYPEGVWLVALANVEDHDVAGEIKRAIGARDQPEATAAEVIAQRFASGPALLILDNCEHVLDGCAELVDVLLSVSTQITVLTTSREHLGLIGEELVRLGTLPLPTNDDQVAENAAAALFVARAAQARRDFALTDANASTVRAICSQLDGIPLALELAAARMAIMTVDDLRQQLEAEGLLDASRRGGDARQRTLRAAIDWSHRLLDADDQVVFRRLSVFRGTFDRTAAAAVVGPGVATLSLERFVAQSLLESDPDAEPARYRFLETIRTYAAERLRESGEGQVQAERHAAHYAQVARACRELTEEADAFDRLGADHPNLLATLEHLAGSDRLADHRGLVVDLFPFWNVRGHWRLAREHHLGYLARDQRDETLDGQVLGQLGVLAYNLGMFADARAVHERGRLVARKVGDRDAEGRRVASLAGVAAILGDYREARALNEEALAIARELGDRRGEGQRVGGLGAVIANLGDYRAASTHMEQAIAIARELGDRRGEGRWAGGLGAVANKRGDNDQARALFEAAVGIARELGDRRSEGRWAGGLGVAHFDLGDYAEARRHFTEALVIARELGDRYGEGQWIGGLGVVACEGGQFQEARAHLEEALGVARELGDRHGESQWVVALAHLASDLRDSSAARALFAEALKLAHELGTPDSELLVGCAEALAGAHRYEEAAQLLAAADELNAQAGKVRAAPTRRRYDGTVAMVREALNEVVLGLAARRGAALDWEAAIAMASSCMR